MAATSPPAVPVAAAASGPAGRARSLSGLARENGLFLVLLAIGALIRLLTMVAYPPALFFGDSWGYVVSAFAGHPVALSNIHPSGYPALMWLLSLPGRDVVQIVAVQHLAGLATGTLVYVALLRAGLARTYAALAAALVLLDGYAITLEQYLMADTFFTLTVLIAGLLLTWPALRGPSSRGPVGTRVAALAGLLLAAAVLIRTAGLFAVLPFAVYLLWTRAGWRAVIAFGLALALPILAYAGAEDARFGAFGLSQTSGWLSYGRVAGFADCAGAGIPADEQPLCETTVQRRSHPDAPTWYIFDGGSPAVRLFGGYGSTVAAQAHSNAVLGAFARRIEHHQPLAYLRAVADDVVNYFTPGATPFDDSVSATALPATAGTETVIEDVRDQFLPTVHPGVRSPSRLVRDYRSAIHVPRPVLALLVLVALIGLVRRVPMRREILLLSGTGLTLIVGTAASAGFGIRYLMPAVPLLALGGMLAARDLWPSTKQRIASSG